MFLYCSLFLVFCFKKILYITPEGLGPLHGKVLYLIGKTMNVSHTYSKEVCASFYPFFWTSFSRALSFFQNESLDCSPSPSLTIPLFLCSCQRPRRLFPSLSSWSLISWMGGTAWASASGRKATWLQRIAASQVYSTLSFPPCDFSLHFE